MSRNYNYNYKYSKKRGNGALIALVAVLAIIAIAVLLIALNWKTLTAKLYDALGMETTTVQTTTTVPSEQTTAKDATTTSGTQTQQTSPEPTGELKWYEKELEYTRNPVNVEPLLNDLRNFVFSFSGQYGISFFDLTSGATFGINDIDYYQAASTIKIPLSLFIYDQVAQGIVNLNKRITYLEEDHEGGTGYIINHGKVGDEFTLRTLINYAIIYSDNIATNMLLREFGRDELRTFMREVGGEIVDDYENVSCPRDMSLYLRLLYLFEKEYPDLGREVFSYLQKTHLMTGGYVNTPEADLRIIRYLPAEVQRVTAHKTGNATGAWHDVGIIFIDQPYVLAVMTYGVLYDEVNDVIANISKRVYEYMINVSTY